jgi:cyclomaltodextrinase / maltogenic alpha-amylase / neopullulanase
MREIVTPEWVKHAVFYQVFPDRFAKSARAPKPANLEPWDTEPTDRGYKGGDLWGVIERLGHLQDLGVTAIWFNPIFQSASNHRYHTHDYFRVDPLLGGDEAFDALLAECRRRGMRVVLDGVFNHCSRGFFQFNDVLENGAASPWVDWFRFRGHPANAYDPAKPPGYEAWWGLHALPKFDTSNPQVREFLMSVGEHWIRRGIDGWRLDVAAEITTPGFWEEFRRRVKALRPDAWIVGEIWGESREWLRGDRFDGVMNYLFTEAAIAFCAGHRVRRDMLGDRPYAPWPGIDGVAFAAKVERLLSLYPWEIQLTQMNLLDSHDTARLVTIAGGDTASVRLATLLMMTFPGAPSVYYGDEIGLPGGPPDTLARRTFPWDRPDTWDRGLLEFHRRAIALRHAHPALRTGAFRKLAAAAGVYAFARTLGDATLVVALNAGDAGETVEVALEGSPGDAAPPVRFGEPVACAIDGGALRLALAPRSGVVVELPAGVAPR